MGIRAVAGTRLVNGSHQYWHRMRVFVFVVAMPKIKDVTFGGLALFNDCSGPGLNLRRWSP